MSCNGRDSSNIILGGLYRPMVIDAINTLFYIAILGTAIVAFIWLPAILLLIAVYVFALCWLSESIYSIGWPGDPLTCFCASLAVYFTKTASWSWALVAVAATAICYYGIVFGGMIFGPHIDE